MFDQLVGEFRDLDEAGLAVQLQQLEQQRRRVDASLAALVTVGANRGVHLADGHASIRGWVKALTNCSDGEAAHFVQLGRLLHDIPDAGERLYVGEIGIAQATELARGNPRCGDQLAEIAPILLDHAAMLPFADFKLCVRRWELMADPDGAYKDRDRANEARTASVHESEEGVHARADGGTGAIAAEMREIFERFCQAEFLTDWDRAVTEFGDAASARGWCGVIRNVGLMRWWRSFGRRRVRRWMRGCLNRP